MTTKRSRPFREYFLLDMNAVVRMMILSDVVWGGAVGLLGPIFAIFIVDFIDGATIAVAGVATSIYLITKSIAQIPAASIIDRIRGEKDDFWILFFGSVAAALIPAFYLIISTPLQLYISQFLYGLIVAFTYPSYMAIFTRHVDKDKVGTEWGIYFTLNDFSAAVTASIGAVLAQTVGFHALIAGVVFVSILGVLLLLPLRPYMRDDSGKLTQAEKKETSV
jgi:MFS family permease